MLSIGALSGKDESNEISHQHLSFGWLLSKADPCGKILMPALVSKEA